MGATQRRTENASRRGLAERDVRALTEYLTVLDDVGRARGAEGLYLVVSQSGREYLVDADQGACECDDFRYRRTECKHLRRVGFATGRRAIPTEAAIDLDVDPGLGEHVEGERRYLATDGGPSRAPGSDDPDEAESEGVRVGAGTEADGEAGTGAGDKSAATPWIVRDRERDRMRAFESRSAAESAAADMRDLGLDVEIVPPAEPGGEGDGIDEPREPPVEADRDGYDLDGRTVAVDPLTWLPAEFVDWIDGTPAINRKGFEVLGHFYDVDVGTEVQVGPAETNREYCQVRATATTADGRRCQALASAHVDRGDDPTLLLELADTRARKRALSIATGVGVVAVEELRSQAEPA